MAKKQKQGPQTVRSLDQALRPSTWDEYVGQKNIKKNLQVLLTAAKKRGEQPEHVLLYGPAGLGKTTLAHLMAKEIGAQLKSTSGPAIERVADLAAILTNLTEGDVFFIDEVHRLNRSIEEVLYPAMESGVLDIIIGKGPSARTVQLELPPFTLVAATTRISLLSAPLRSRFSGGTFRLSYYTEPEIETILARSARILDVSVPTSALLEIARRARATPRTANYLLKRCRDFAQVANQNISPDIVREALVQLQIDELGLTQHDREMLITIIEKYGGGPVGLKTLAAALSEDEGTIEEVHEPFLMQLGLLERTSRGRVATKKAHGHVGLGDEKTKQKRLL